LITPLALFTVPTTTLPFFAFTVPPLMFSVALVAVSAIINCERPARLALLIAPPSGMVSMPALTVVAPLYVFAVARVNMLVPCLVKLLVPAIAPLPETV